MDRVLFDSGCLETPSGEACLQLCETITWCKSLRVTKQRDKEKYNPK